MHCAAHPDQAGKARNGLRPLYGAALQAGWTDARAFSHHPEVACEGKREAAAKRVLKTVANAGDAYDILNVSPTDTAGVVGLYKCVLFYYKSFLLSACTS